MTAKHIDSGAAVHEVVDHLGCYLTRVSAHSFSRNAMIRGDDVNSFAAYLRRSRLLNRRETIRDIFETTEAGGRLGKTKLASGSLLDPQLVHSFDPCVEFV